VLVGENTNKGGCMKEEKYSFNRLHLLKMQKMKNYVKWIINFNFNVNL